MRSLIVCNNEGCWNFPEAEFIILNGDMVNLFPKPPKPLQGSIAYEVAGSATASALNDFALYKSGRTEGKRFREFADALFRGEYSQEARSRYKEDLQSGLEMTNLPGVIVHGNLDFPDIVKSEAERYGFKYIDNEVRYGIGGVGGIPESSNPVGGKFKVFESETNDKIYKRMLNDMSKKCMLLVTHMSFAYYKKLKEKPECMTVVSAETKGESNKKVIVPPDYSVTGQVVWIDV